MIRYKDKVFEDYFIDPITAVITDKNGVVQKTYICREREVFKKMHVHRIMAHTYIGYEPDKIVHHIDWNKSNNALSNLVYMTSEEHSRLHNKGKHSPLKGRPLSEETKKKISNAVKGERNGMYGEKGRQHYLNLSEEVKQKIKQNISYIWTGRKHTEESKKMMSEHNFNKLNGIPDDVKQKMKQGQIGMHFYNNGVIETRSKTEPGEGWVRGRLKHDQIRKDYKL